MSDQPHYPYRDGDHAVLGPEVTATADGMTICWKGAKYRRDHGEHVGAATPLICSDERHATKVAALQADLDHYEEHVVGDLNEKNIALAQRAGRAEAAIARVRSLAADMRESADTRWFADQLTGALDGAPSAPATTRYIHVTITNRDEYTANRAALSLVDWIHAEFTGLQVTTDAHEWDAPAATEATEPATITDPEYLRQQYTAIISALHDNRPDHIATELLRVHARHLQQRLELANQERAAHNGPTVAEAAADDRRWWNGQKAGE